MCHWSNQFWSDSCEVSMHWLGVGVGKIAAEACDQLFFPLLSDWASEDVFFVFYGVVA